MRILKEKERCALFLSITIWIRCNHLHSALLQYIVHKNVLIYAHGQIGQRKYTLFLLRVKLEKKKGRYGGDKLQRGLPCSVASLLTLAFSIRGFVVPFGKNVASLPLCRYMICVQTIGMRLFECQYHSTILHIDDVYAAKNLARY